jgi:hypothetical protein
VSLVSARTFLFSVEEKSVRRQDLRDAVSFYAPLLASYHFGPLFGIALVESRERVGDAITIITNNYDIISHLYIENHYLKQQTRVVQLATLIIQVDFFIRVILPLLASYSIV